MDPIVVYVDGGCHNNGCPDSIAYGSFKVYFRGDLKRTVGFDLPDAHTNNQAEYNSLIKVINYLMEDKRRLKFPIVIKTDSQLMVGQLTQDWKVKSDSISNQHRTCHFFFTLFPHIRLEKVDREEIVKILGH